MENEPRYSKTSANEIIFHFINGFLNGMIPQGAFESSLSSRDAEVLKSSWRYGFQVGKNNWMNKGKLN